MMVEIPGSVTIIPAPIEQVLMSVVEELLLYSFITAVFILLAIYAYQKWMLEAEVDDKDAEIAALKAEAKLESEEDIPSDVYELQMAASQLEAEVAALKAELNEINKARMLTVEVPDSWVDEEMPLEDESKERNDKMSKEFDPTERYIKITIDDKILTTGELWSIYEALCDGLAETSVDIFKGRSMIAAATQRIGKLLGLDKITEAADEEEKIE